MGTAKAALSLCAALLLAGCGFRPLYGTASVPEGAQAAFAAVQIAPIAQTNDSDRIGFILEDELKKALHAPGAQGPARYVLTVTLADERRGLGIQDDASITRFNYRLSADFTVARVGQAQPFSKGRAETTASYNVVDSQYSTQVARLDAERRAAHEIAEQLKLRIAVALMNDAQPSTDQKP